MSEPTRRSFLDALLFTSLAATAFATLAPVPRYFFPPAEASRRRRLKVGPAAELPKGTARKLLLGDRPVIVLNDGELRAFDARCTHQQCPVNWDAAGLALKCPCHGAVFDSAGRPVSGPARSPLTPLRLEVTAGGDVVIEG